MKGICHLWSRGRHFSPSLPGDRYLKFDSQKRSPGRNLGEHRLVRRSGIASRGTALLVFSSRMRSFTRTDLLTICMGKNIRVPFFNFTSVRHASLFEAFAVLMILQFSI